MVNFGEDELAVIGFFGVIALMILKGGKKSTQFEPEETKIMQEIHKGLEKMDRRMESLETILFDKELGQTARKESNHVSGN